MDDTQVFITHVSSPESSGVELFFVRSTPYCLRGYSLTNY